MAEAIVADILPRFDKVGLIVPVPPSKLRARQPAYEVAKAIRQITAIPVFENIVVTRPGPQGQLKDLPSKEEKVSALAGRSLSMKRSRAKGAGTQCRWTICSTPALPWKLLAPCCGYRKIARIYAVALTWK